MKTFDEKLQAIFMEVLGVHISQSVHNKLKALFEAETLEIIGEDEYIENEYYGGNKQVRDKLRNKQRTALKEKLGKTKEQS
jgi:hypothetical protein